MLVLHVGPHKTATTYLQGNFHNQRTALRKRGWLYPSLGERVRIAHHDLAEQADGLLAGTGGIVADIARIRKRAPTNEDGVLLSAESFRRWKPQHLGALMALMRPHELRVVYALRDPLSVLHSMWAQSVKLGHTEDLPGFVARHADRPDRSRFLNPLREIEPVLKRCAVSYVILPYDEIARRKLDIYAVFMEEALGLHGMQPTVKAASNVRLPIEQTEFIRMLSKRLPHFEAREGVRIGDAFERLFSVAETEEIVRTVRDLGASARRVVEMSRQEPGYIAREQRLMDTLGSMMRPRPADLLFPRRPETWVHYDDKDLAAVPAVAALLDDAAHRLRAGSPRLIVLNQATRWLIRGRRLKKQLT